MLYVVTKMILLIGLLCITLFIILKILNRKKGVGQLNSSNSLIKILDSRWIAPQKYISIVDIGGELFALGVSESQITLLTKIENKEWAQKISEVKELKSSPLFNIQRALFQGDYWKALLRRSNER